MWKEWILNKIDTFNIKHSKYLNLYFNVLLRHLQLRGLGTWITCLLCGLVPVYVMNHVTEHVLRMCHVVSHFYWSLNNERLADLALSSQAVPNFQTFNALENTSFQTFQIISDLSDSSFSHTLSYPCNKDGIVFEVCSLRCSVCLSLNSYA